MTAAASTAPARGLSTYSRVAIAFHWVIAALVLTNIGLAWYFGTLKGEAEVAPLAIHKSIGITVLLLTLARIGWRFTSRPPPLPASMKRWEVWAARTSHFVFYVLMLGLPLSGWAMVSASPLIKVHPTVLYGVVPWPAFPYPDLDSDALHAARKLMAQTHEKLAWLAYATIAVHVLAAFKHLLIDRDDVMARMVPFLSGKSAR